MLLNIIIFSLLFLLFSACDIAVNWCDNLLFFMRQMLLYFSIFFCPGTDLSATVPPIGVNFFAMAQLCPGRIFFTFSVAISVGVSKCGAKKGGEGRSLESDLTANGSKTVSRSLKYDTIRYDTIR